MVQRIKNFIKFNLRTKKASTNKESFFAITKENSRKTNFKVKKYKEWNRIEEFIAWRINRLGSININTNSMCSFCFIYWEEQIQKIIKPLWPIIRVKQEKEFRGERRLTAKNDKDIKDARKFIR